MRKRTLVPWSEKGHTIRRPTTMLAPLARTVTAMAVVALLVGLLGTSPAGARPADCFTDYGGVVGAGEVVPGDLQVTRQTPGVDPTGLGRGSICLVLGTVQGNVAVVDETEMCTSRPPFTALELAGGTIEGNVRSTGNACAMIWLRDGTWVGGDGASTVDRNVIVQAPGNLGFLGNGAGAIVEGNAILQAVGSGLFANGASTTNRVHGHIICEGGAPAGGTGSGTETNWDGIDPEIDGTIGGKYKC